MIDYTVFTHSTTSIAGTTYQLVRSNTTGEKRLAVRGVSDRFQHGFACEDGWVLFPLLPANASELRSRLPWLCPSPLGVQTSFGFGDRLGIATPGHIQALKGMGIAPVFAQQSVRENTRTRRTPQQVLDDAMWGIFQEGWRFPWGADADHLKDCADLMPFTSAGYTFYTFDVRDLIDDQVHVDTLPVLAAKYPKLPWDELEISPSSLMRLYLNKHFHLQHFSLAFDETTLLRAAIKYGRAIAHIAKMHQCLQDLMNNKPYDLEISLDESETPTTPHEHFFIANELRRLGVQWISLAPHFVGRFEKGVDYIGDLANFEAELKQHTAVMQYFGGYKLSLHSGSDKLSIYPILARHTKGKLHVKTAGTSYLEALRVVAGLEPKLFREIVNFSLQRYPSERITYHVSASVEKIPPVDTMNDNELPGILDLFDARQVLHVTFGSVLDHFGTKLSAILANSEAAYHDQLKDHFTRHLKPISEVITDPSS